VSEDNQEILVNTSLPFSLQCNNLIGAGKVVWTLPNGKKLKESEKDLIFRVKAF